MFIGHVGAPLIIFLNNRINVRTKYRTDRRTEARTDTIPLLYFMLFSVNAANVINV